MSNFDPNDPAAEIKYLKALERAKTPAWPAMPDDPAKVKKAAAWPAAAEGKPKKPPRHVPHSWLLPDMEKRQVPPMTSTGPTTWGDRFIFLALLGATLYLVAALALAVVD